MSYSLHYAKHYAPDWEGQYSLNYQAWDSLFYDKFHETGWASEHEDEYEISRPTVEEYIKELLKSPDEENEYSEQLEQPITNKQLAAALQEILDGSQDDDIRVEWF